MNARLFTIIFICLIIAASITLIVLISIRLTTKPSPAPALISPTPVLLNLPEGKTIEVSGVPVNNPYNSPVQLSAQGDSLMVKTPEYNLVYLKPFGEFLISITASPFEENRQAAESALLTRLGISQAQACSLKVTITTPVSVNPNEAGQNYPLSFCQ